MNKKQIQSEQTRKRIADAARNLFVQKGYKASSIEDITAATGSSKGNIYYHFKSKEGLFMYLLDEWDLDWYAKWREKEHLFQTAADKMYGFAELLVTEDLNHPLTQAADEFFGGEIESDVREKLAEMTAGHMRFNRDLIQAGIDSGEFKRGDADRLALVLESLVIGLSRVSRRPGAEDALSTYRLAVDVLLYGLAKEPED
ncbi:TetR/AcrR family transcriptional regulator [Saccharibacillus sp. CPCC 101409]|uniref:TetR/AcrR family transcriptional regulator n=1 Tax=Saccharibacillus sp. CPCC 101409 TaxID=3058041 RepID=UPI002671094D|nr:TetR/AcrR family transcriptional regulator [Saccharibacillus sp. CPCC 101409]MDO3412606.1 TetR/AcrR family transcriptional regulator [Saccharibacillus sp. CPCC 101409]